MEEFKGVQGLEGVVSLRRIYYLQVCKASCRRDIWAKFKMIQGKEKQWGCVKYGEGREK